MAEKLEVTGRDGTRYVAVRKKYRYPYGKTREGWLISKNSGEDRPADDFTSALCDALLAARRDIETLTAEKATAKQARAQLADELAHRERAEAVDAPPAGDEREREIRTGLEQDRYLNATDIRYLLRLLDAARAERDEWRQWHETDTRIAGENLRSCEAECARLRESQKALLGAIFAATVRCEKIITLTDHLSSANAMHHAGNMGDLARIVSRVLQKAARAAAESAPAEKEETP